MSYISTIRRGNDVLVWERGTSGQRELIRYPAPFRFYTEDDNGTHESIFGKSLVCHDFKEYDQFYKIKEHLKQSRTKLYESDISAEIKVLSEHYYNKPAPDLHISLYDIEVFYNETVGFSSPSNPYAPVCSVSIHHLWKNKTIIFAVPPPKWDRSTFDESLKTLAEVVLCIDEKDLLRRFINEIQDSDILSGWNSNYFDMPYVAKRIESQLGPKYLRKLSFDEADTPKYKDAEVYGRIQPTVLLSGRVHLDYLELFGKYEEEKRQSYKLESVAEEVLPHLPKLKYEGSLNNLYQNDFNFFMRYNIRDTEILEGFERKLGYIRLANVMCHISTGQFKDVLGTIRLSDYAFMNFCHYHLNMRVPDYQSKDTGEEIKGAWVLLPQSGLHDWIAAVDYKSLYPSCIIAINISPETLIGQFLEKAKAWEKICKDSEEILLMEHNDETGTIEEHTAREWKQILRDNKWAISGYGTIFDQKKPGILPTILMDWYKQRKDYQKLKGDEIDLSKAVKGIDQQAYDYHIDKSEYYNRLQYVYKIKLNSFYGALLNVFFRFFDPRLGGSVTGTGRSVLYHQAKKITELFGQNYDVNFPLYETVEEALEHNEPAETALHGPHFKGQFESETILYGDTDSCYFKTWASNKEEAIKIADTIAVEVNKSIKPYMRDAFMCQPGYDEKIQTSLELVSDRGIFVVKKRYVLHLVYFEDKEVDKLKVKGLEMKKTTTPKAVQKFLDDVVRMILRGDEWSKIDGYIIKFRDNINFDVPFFELGLPIGVKNVEDYTQQYKIGGDKTRLPGNVAATIHYNQCLTKYDDKVSPQIFSGSKIKIFYLKEKQGKFTSIALPTDIDIIPEWFTMDYQPLIDRERQADRLVDDNLELIFKAIGKEVPTRQTLLTNDLIGI